MKLHYLTLALGLTLMAAGCEQSDKDTRADVDTPALTVSDDSPVLATVNGTPITEKLLSSYQQQRNTRRPNDANNNNPQALLEELINLELARQAGEKMGLDQQAEVELQIDQQKRAVIAAAAIQKQLQEHPVSDEDLKKLYEENVGEGKEYRARHILVAEEQKARDLIGQLDQGADFSELAKQHSTGPSGKTGGELGWFSAGQMVQPFSDALAGMEKGSYTKEPVKTQFGWHVIMLDDMRESKVPSFEQVKPQLRMLAQNQRVQEYVASLRSEADIEIKQAAAPAEAEPAQPEAPETPPGEAPAATSDAGAQPETETETGDEAAADDATPAQQPAAEQ